MLYILFYNYRNEEKKFISKSQSIFSFFALSYATDKELGSVLLKASIAPWLWGRYSYPQRCFTFIPSKFALRVLLVNSFSWSDWISSG